MQEAQYDFLHGQTDRSDFFSPDFNAGPFDSLYQNFHVRNS